MPDCSQQPSSFWALCCKHNCVSASLMLTSLLCCNLQLMENLNFPQALEEINQAAKWLREQGAPKVSQGDCMSISGPATLHELPASVCSANPQCAAYSLVPVEEVDARERMQRGVFHESTADLALHVERRLADGLSQLQIVGAPHRTFQTCMCSCTCFACWHMLLQINRANSWASHTT